MESFLTAARKQKLRSAFDSWQAVAIDQKCLSIVGKRIAARSKLSCVRKVFQVCPCTPDAELITSTNASITQMSSRTDI